MDGIAETGGEPEAIMEHIDTLVAVLSDTLRSQCTIPSFATFCCL